MNLGAYTEALKGAEQVAVMYSECRVVVYYPIIKEFGQYSISAVVLSMSPEFRPFIVASVDHNGIITESKWIRDQREKMLDGVAA